MSPYSESAASVAEARKCLAAALIIVQQQQLYDIQFFSPSAFSVV